MSKSNITPLELVARYHTIYLEYENAINQDESLKQDQEKEIKKLIETGVDIESDEFIESMFQIIDDKGLKIASVQNAAARFILYADFYLSTHEEDLPESIKKDYENLPLREQLKPPYVVENNKLVSKKKQEMSEERKQFYRNIVEQIKKQQ